MTRTFSDLFEERIMLEESRRRMLKLPTTDEIAEYRNRKGGIMSKRVDKPVNHESSKPKIETVGVLHRIVADGVISQWFGYQQVAVLKTPKNTYYAATDYHHGNLPTCQVFTTTII